MHPSPLSQHGRPCHHHHSDPSTRVDFHPSIVLTPVLSLVSRYVLVTVFISACVVYVYVYVYVYIATPQTLFNECWMETEDEVSQLDCPVRPWDFTGPGIALWCAIFQVSDRTNEREHGIIGFWFLIFLCS